MSQTFNDKKLELGHKPDFGVRSVLFPQKCLQMQITGYHEHCQLYVCKDNKNEWLTAVIKLKNLEMLNKTIIK
jgi:hypothetical protein